MLMPIYDPSDVEIPEAGTIMCKDSNHQQIIYTNDIKARKRYHELWMTYKQQLETLSKKLQIPTAWVETTADPVRKLWMS